MRQCRKMYRYKSIGILCDSVFKYIVKHIITFMVNHHHLIQIDIKSLLRSAFVSIETSLARLVYFVLKIFLPFYWPKKSEAF